MCINTFIARSVHSVVVLGVVKIRHPDFLMYHELLLHFEDLPVSSPKLLLLAQN